MKQKTITCAATKNSAEAVFFEITSLYSQVISKCFKLAVYFGSAAQKISKNHTFLKLLHYYNVNFCFRDLIGTKVPIFGF
jgi:hypothetical protein